MPVGAKEGHRTDASAGCAQRYWARTTAFFHIESGARRGSRACHSQQHSGRGGRRPGGWGNVDGCGEYVSVHSQADTGES